MEIIQRTEENIKSVLISILSDIQDYWSIKWNILHKKGAIKNEEFLEIKNFDHWILKINRSLK